MNNQTHTEAAHTRFEHDLNTAFQNGYAEGQKHPLGACDHAAAARAYGEGCKEGERKASNDLKSSRDVVQVQGKEIHNLIGERETMKKAFEERLACERRAASEQRRNFDEAANLANNRAARIDVLIRQRDEARAERDNLLRIPSGQWQTLKAALDLIPITPNNIGDIRQRFFFPHNGEWNRLVYDETAARELRTILVGDVWRSVNERIRCVSEITRSGKILYQHKISSGTVMSDSAASVSEFLFNCGAGATVTRGAFSPAKFDGEPPEGFMVGDVWTRPNGGTRTIVSVSDTEIGYDYRTGSDDHDIMILANDRARSNYPLNFNSATLVRK